MGGVAALGGGVVAIVGAALFPPLGTAVLLGGGLATAAGGVWTFITGNRAYKENKELQE